MNSVDIVQRWQHAANQHDVLLLRELSDDAIEIVGPRGSARGQDVLIDWAQRAGAEFMARRVFVRGERVVVAQHGVWRSIEGGEIIGQADVATSFLVKDWRVARVARYDALDQALRDAGLTVGDEVTAM